MILILNYEDGCPNGYNCKYTHGRKEFEYHPFYYRTKPCETIVTKKECLRDISCSYYHNQSQRNVISPHEMFFFEYAPKNKLLQGVNKIFLDKNLHGLTDLNKYSPTKDPIGLYEIKPEKLEAPVMPYQHELSDCKESSEKSTMSDHQE